MLVVIKEPSEEQHSSLIKLGADYQGEKKHGHYYEVAETNKYKVGKILNDNNKKDSKVS